MSDLENNPLSNINSLIFSSLDKREAEAVAKDAAKDLLIADLVEALEDAANELDNAQGEYSPISETYAPEWTHSLKTVEAECMAIIAKARGQ